MGKTKNRLIVFLCGVLFSVFCGCASTELEDKEKDAKLQAERKEQWYKDSTGNMADGKISPQVEAIESSANINLERRLPVNPYPIYAPKTTVPLESSSPAQTPAPQLKSTEPVKVSFDFNAAHLADVIPVFADLLKINYQIDGNLNGTVTLFFAGDLTPMEIWDLLRYVLHGAGAYVSATNHLMVFKSVENLPLDTTFANQAGSSEFAVFRLKNLGTKEAVAQFGTFLSKGNKPLELISRNTVIVLDTKDVIAKLRFIVDEMDQPIRQGWAKMVIPCRNVDARKLVAELGEILPVLGFPVALNNNPQPEEIQLIAVDRLQVLVASSASYDALDELGRWTGILDQSEVGEQEKMYVYNIINGNADELVKALSVMFPVEGATMTPGGKDGTSGTAQDTAINSKSNSAADKKLGQSSVFEIPVKVFADAVNERLLIRTTPRAYAMVKALLEKIDTIPAQVLLQVMIVDVSLNDSVKFGVEFMMQGQGDNVGTSGGTNYTGLLPADGQKAQSGGRFHIFNPQNPDEKYGYINALAGKTNIKVVSNPQILIASRSEAKISVGNKVPIVNSEITNTASITPGDTNLVRNIQYQDTGIILKITPRITRGGRISIVIDQTVSEADRNTTSDIDSPIIKEQIINTTMSIRDGQTIICGGMIREKTSDTLSTVPVIGGIPFLRRLFGDSNVGVERAEMMILISGTIVSENSQLESMLQKYQDSVDTLIEFNLPQEERKRKLDQKKGLLETWFIE